MDLETDFELADAVDEAAVALSTLYQQWFDDGADRFIDHPGARKSLLRLRAAVDAYLETR